MKFLIFSDLHAFLRNDIEKIKEDFDIIIFLGDINGIDLRCVANSFPDKPVYAVLGNHDSKDLFDTSNFFLERERKIMQKPFLYPIKNINLKKENIHGLTITGLEGSVKYKPTSIGYTQEEAFSLDIPVADILFSHDTGYHYVTAPMSLKTHEGLKAISKYIEEVQPKYHFFGHHHIDTQFTKGKTKCFGICGCSLFDIETEELKKIF